MHLSIWLLILAVFIFPIKTISEEKEEKTETHSPCYRCHQIFWNNIKDKKNIHEPVKNDDCNSCHEDHGKSNILVLKAPILEICAQCHDYKEDDFKKMHQGIFIKNCVKCHNPHAGTNDKLIYTNQHTPFLKRQCKDCHIQNNDTTKLKIPLTQICRSCHIEKNILNQESKYHLPFLAGQCTSCHDPHTSENPNILKLNSEELCITGCHLPIRNEKNEHMPVKTRECLKCHLPHQSSNKYLLKILNNKKMTALNDLCQECHNNILDKKNVHLVVLTGECDTCHKNHNAPYKKLLINEGKDLCYLSACHTKFEQKEFIHKPVDDGKCTSCHDPHSSLNKKLLIIKEDVIINTIYRLCYQCHKPFENKPGIHKPVAEGKCDLCHNIHSSDNESLLLNAERQLCESCHLDKSKVKEHARGIEGNKHCTECHDAHYPRQK